MRSSLLLTLIAIVVATPSIVPRRARAQPVSMRLLDRIEADPTPGNRSVRISFTLPVRYLRHAPRSRGETVHIQFSPLEITAAAAPSLRRRESLQIPRDFPLPIEEVTYEGLVAGQPSLEVRFEREQDFEVRQGEDVRSLVITILPARRKEARGASGPAEVAGPEADRIEELMQEGRRAMTAGEFERAAAIYTKVLAYPENPKSPEAQEFLGLARERKGQLAHAKAEYEAYLERWPDGEGADRVQQRLAALVTARKEPDLPPRDEPPEDRPLDLRSFGSIYAGYRRELIFPEGEEELVADSSFYTDLHMETRLRTDRYTVKSQMTGGYRREFLDGGSDETRTNALFIEAEDHEIGLLGSLGRRSLSTAGVLGRFDGIRLAYDVDERWTVGLVAGLPVDSPEDTRIRFDRYFAGVSLDVAKLAESFDVQVYAIGQMDGGITDRVGVGCEIRHFANGRFAVAFVDYDAYFNELNLAQLVGNWQVTPSTLLTTFLDYRLVPTLTTRNALQGQAVGDLSDLLDSLSRSELRDLAKDRTAHATNLSFGVNQQLASRLQLAADFNAMDYSGTTASGGVDAMEGTGFEFAYSTQLIWSELIKPGGVGILGLRFFDGTANDILTGSLDGRYPITRDLRANPRLRADYRMIDGGADVFSLLPSFRLDYRIWKVNFDAEVAFEWRPSGGAATADEQWGYAMTFGIRYDY